MIRPAPAVRILLSFAVAALALQAGFRLWIRPDKLGALNQERDRIARLTAELRAIEDPAAGGAARQAADAVRADLDRTLRQVEVLRGVLGAEAEAAGILDSIAGIASDEGLRLRRFAPDPAFPIGPFLAHTATVEAEGRYFDFLRFFERIAELGRVVVVDEFDLLAPAEPGGLLTGRFVAMTVAAESGTPDFGGRGR